MKTMCSTLINSIAATCVALMLTACGSDGGGGGGGSTGTTSLSLTDAPIDEALDVTVRFDGVEFQPADGDRFMLYLADTTGTCEVVDVQDSANPCEVNLLDYQGIDRITIVDRATMPAGKYSWLRLILNDEPGSIILIDGSQFDLRVPRWRGDRP